jgi:hypothetical protein
VETHVLQAFLFSRTHLFLFRTKKSLLFPMEDTYEEQVLQLLIPLK